MSSSFSFPRAPGEENKSMAEIFATLPQDIQDTLLKSLTEDQVEALRYDADFWLRPKQMIDGDDWYITALTAGRGFGKGLELSTKILTRNSWKTMAEIVDGDVLFDEMGQTCTVVKAHDPYMPKKMFRITFSDGETIEADADHLWTTWTHSDRKSYNRRQARSTEESYTGVPDNWYRWQAVSRYGRPTGTGPKTRDTQEIYDTQVYGNRGDRNHSIPVTRPLTFPELESDLGFYTLGAWLGDGLHKSGEICGHSDDLPHILSAVEKDGHKTASIRLSKRGGEVVPLDVARIEGLHVSLKREGLLGNKHIPNKFLMGSVEQRESLLAGLLDTDGSINLSNGCVEFSNTNMSILNGIMFLLRSLGEKPILSFKKFDKSKFKNAKDAYRVTFRPKKNYFRLPRKANRFVATGNQVSRNYHRMITRVEEIPPTMVRCLTVDSESRLFLAGEGLIPTHNTRTGSEWIRKKARENPGCRIALAGRTVADVRNVLVMGDSGILAVSPPDERPEYKQHHASLVWPNGSTALLLSSESPDQARGPQFHYALGDEFAAWRHMKDASGATLYDNLLAATRLGDNPQLVLATTPKRTPVMKDLYERAKDPSQKIRMITGATTENTALSSTYIDNLKRQYGDSDLARQEIEGVMLDDADGIVFSDELIKKSKAYGPRPSGLHYIIAVDPSVAADPKTADECGIMVLGCTRESDPFQRKVYLVEDGSIRASPDVWADRVVELAKKYRIRDIVAEANQGGALITSIINTRAPHLSVHLVHATKGKIKRVEPVVVAMQQGRIKLAGDFPDLEDQLLFYDPDSSGYSPDRMDAFAWGVTALVISPPKTLMFSTVRAFSPRLSAPPASRTIDSMKSSHTRRSLPSR